MSKVFDGAFDVDFHEGKNEYFLKKNPDGDYTAEDAELVWAFVVAQKQPVSRWSFYIADFNQTISKEIHQFDPAKAVAWLKRQKVETVTTVTVGKYGKPCLRIDPITTTAKAGSGKISRTVSKAEMLAALKRK
jgi:hypothetical protein